MSSAKQKPIVVGNQFRQENGEVWTVTEAIIYYRKELEKMQRVENPVQNAPNSLTAQG